MNRLIGVDSLVWECGVVPEYGVILGICRVVVAKYGVVVADCGIVVGESSALVGGTVD